MNVTGVTIYCLPNIRHPWVLAYEPHPWGCGALRVKESSAIIVYQRLPSPMELAWLADSKTYMCVTFDTAERLIHFEDGQHEHAQDVRDSIESKRVAVNAILAKSAKKRDDKARKIRKRDRRTALPLV